MIQKCPGQDARNRTTAVIRCPSCGYDVEIFSDEIKRACPQCKKLVFCKDMPSCVDWCSHAKECIGDVAFQERSLGKRLLLKERLLQELETYFGTDARRINHAKRVLGFAEEILRAEGGAWEVVVPASILHDVGIKVAEEKFGTSSGKYQEKEGPAIARGILLKLGFGKAQIDEICEIIGHHHTPQAIDSQNFKVLLDADWLVNIQDEVDPTNKEKVKQVIEKVFFTKTARTLARKEYLGEGC